MASSLVSAVLVACLYGMSKEVHAAKDSTYYPAGLSNPNVLDRMYWHEAADVLTDLGKFDKLYVQYHGCA